MKKKCIQMFSVFLTVFIIFTMLSPLSVNAGWVIVDPADIPGPDIDMEEVAGGGDCGIPDSLLNHLTAYEDFGMHGLEILTPTEEDEYNFSMAIGYRPKKIALLRIFSVGSGTSSLKGNYGHSWITITNLSAKRITIGKLSGIRQGKTVSIGTWGISPKAGEDADIGLWYNREAWRIKNGDYRGRLSYSYLLSQVELNKVNNIIAISDKHSLQNNCTTFATRVWNAVAAHQYKLQGRYFGIDSPAALVGVMLKIRRYNQDAAVPYNGAVYKARGMGTPYKKRPPF